MESPQNPNQSDTSNTDDDDKVLDSFIHFLKYDLEKQIHDIMLIANAEPHVVTIQEPQYCPGHMAKIYTRGIVDIGGKHYIMDIIANWDKELIYIGSDAFGFFVNYNFDRNSVYGWTMTRPIPEILQGQCLDNYDMEILTEDLKW